MKEETKKTIEWIKDILKAYKDYATNNNIIGVNEYITKYYKAIKFLDSLPEIESHLCRGGYIQDKNGTPCCEGDTVLCLLEYPASVSYKPVEGKLIWNKETAMFLLEMEDDSQFNMALVKSFEKVKL